MKPGLALAAVLCGMVASALMQTLLAVATPGIVGEFDASRVFEWVAGAYLIASLGATLLAGQLADRLGARTVFVAGWLGYLAGTLLVVTATRIGGLLVGRAVQGLGAGLIVPAGLAAFGILFDPRTRGTVIGLAGTLQVVATLIGPLWGGWVTDGPGWRWGMAPAAVLGAAALSLAVNLPTGVRAPGWWRLNPCATFGLLRDRRLARATLASALAGAVMIALVTYMPLGLQQLEGMDASATGVRLIALLLGSGVGAMVGGRLADRGWLLPVGWLVAGTGLALLIGSAAPVIAGLGMVGLGLGPVLPVVLLRAQDAVSTGQLAQASSLIQLGRIAGSAVLVPLLGVWLRLPLGTALPVILGSLLVLTAAGLLVARPTSKETR